MKTQLFFAICLLFAVFAVKGQPRTPADLKLGDWLELEYITFLRDSTPGDIWRAEDMMKIRFRGTVIRKSAKEVAFSFKPVHLFRSTSNRHVIDRRTPLNGTLTDAYLISDSYFKDYDEDFHFLDYKQLDFKMDSFMFTIRLPECSIQSSPLKEKNTHLSKRITTYWYVEFTCRRHQRRFSTA